MSTFQTKIKALRARKLGRHVRKLRNIPLVAIVIVATVIICGGAFAEHEVVLHNNKKSNANTVAIGTEQNNSNASLHDAATIKGSGKQGSGSQPSNSENNSSSQPVIKYKTDSDPRSTAYSLTPPKPNPANFTTIITHNGQIAPGTLISYNANKNGTKTYYGGDYNFSSPSITINKKQSLYSNAVSISTPDSQQANEPALPWNVTNPAAYPFEVSPENPATTWSMVFSTSASQPDGTYQIHLTSLRTSAGEPAWEYDGFLTIVIEN